MVITPLGEKALIVLDEPETKIGNLHLVNSEKVFRGTVLSLSEDWKETEISVGDRVIVNKRSGTDLQVGQKVLSLYDAYDIIAKEVN